jgi:hypothetical protein
MNAPAHLIRPAPVVYRAGETNRFPMCTGTAWFVGRSSAECGTCGHPLPLAHKGR